jgi:hypothetical protein
MHQDHSGTIIRQAGIVELLVDAVKVLYSKISFIFTHHSAVCSAKWCGMRVPMTDTQSPGVCLAALTLECGRLRRGPGRHRRRTVEQSEVDDANETRERARERNRGWEGERECGWVGAILPGFLAVWFNMHLMREKYRSSADVHQYRNLDKTGWVGRLSPRENTAGRRLVGRRELPGRLRLRQHGYRED